MSLKQSKDGKKMINATRKEYFHAIAIGKDDGERDINLFNKAKGADGMTIFDINWPSANNTMPDHIAMILRRLGFSVITASGTAVKPATIMKLSRAVLTVKVGDREIQNTSLISFFKQPMSYNPDGTMISDGNSGPNYRDIQAEELKPGSLFDYSLHLPAAIGQDVILYSLLDTDTELNSKQ